MMTKEEALVILAIMKSAYPKDYPFNMTEKEAKVVAMVWCEQFADVPGEIVKLAVKKLIAKEERCFSIATVKKQLGSMYWEAHTRLDEARRGFITVPEDKILLYEHIKKVTEQYHYSKTIEPSIEQLVGNDTKTLLLGGKVSDG